MLYANKSKQSQDCLLLKYTNQSLPKKRSETVDGKRKVAVTTTYFVPRKTGNVKVCQKTFLNALRVSKDRVRILCQRHFLKGETPKERRGGYRVNQAFAEKRQTVKNFIDQLQPVESHYGRDKSTRLYLQCDLNIRKLWRLYNSAQGSSCSQVKYEFFRGIFTKDYNISFKTPATDACSTCIELRLSIQNSNGAEKIHNMAMLRVHRLKAKAFYDELRTEKSDTLMLAFDCQKNLVLPKVPDQSAYFSRQLYLFNFTVCAGSSKSEQNKETVTIYPWLENEYYRNANQIASTVFYQLNTTAFETNITNVQLFADGCPGQNKNMVLIGMLMYWLQMKAPKHVKIIEVVFPVVGHSFLPPDRVFGRIERSIKKRESIVNPNEYIEIFEESGTVRQFGNNNLLVYNWKSALGKILKPTAQWHFKISLCKRIICICTKSS
ncbi:uncharacterized protein LOC130902959 [Diorhabda carinulata]|uniref:uncharacterized protein LOC130902959 n=1 Tax=Diorhabda carinulata TaxID=1163345 RepID=UPI0025A1A36E|nr:uncharacterized protein LOC130902959 [Diorhabda carinulata]